MEKDVKTVGVWSGGGANGAVFAGQFEWMLPRGDLSEFDVVAGSSVGAGAAAAVATGQIAEYISAFRNIRNRDVYKGKLNTWNIIAAQLTRRGYVLNTQPLLDFLWKMLGDAEWYIPCIIPRVNLWTGKLEYVDSSLMGWLPKKERNRQMVHAVYESMLMPGIFKPHQSGLYYYIDGGVLSNLPLGIVKRLHGGPGGDLKIRAFMAGGQDVEVWESTFGLGKKLKLLNQLNRTLAIILAGQVRAEIRTIMDRNEMSKSSDQFGYFDLSIIETDYRERVAPWDFDNCHHLIDYGYDQMEQLENYKNG